MHIECRFVEFTGGQTLLSISRKLSRVVLLVFGSINVLTIVNAVAQRADLLVFNFIPIFEPVKSGILTYLPSAILFLDKVFVRRVKARRWSL